MKKAMLLITAAAMLSLAACTAKTQAVMTVDEPDTPVADANTADTADVTDITDMSEEGPIYCFVGGILAGSYENGQWISHNGLTEGEEGHQYYYGDVLSADHYRIWHDEEEYAVSNTMFFYEDDTDSVLLEASEAAGEGMKRISFPLEAESPLATAEYPMTSFGICFYEKDLRIFKTSVSINTDRIITPIDIDLFATPDNKAKNALSMLLSAEGINTIHSIDECLTADFDGDGREEQLIASNTAKNLNGRAIFATDAENAGTYSVILYVDDDGTAQTLFSDVRIYKEGDSLEDYNQTVMLLGVYDIDGDGRYEACCKFIDGENGYVFVNAFDTDGAYKTVMKGVSGS